MEHRIAIIGSSSFLAKSIIKHASHVELKCFNRKGPHHYNYPKQSIDSLEFAQLSNYDQIIYCAAGGVQPDSQESENLINALNYQEPKLLIEKLNRTHFKGQLITFGSYFEIGNTLDCKPYAESDIIASNNTLPNTYCTSKKKLTLFAHKNIEQNGFKHLHLILTNVYGVGENENRLLPYLTQSFKQGKEVSLTSGGQIRQYTHVDDVSRFILDMRTKDLKGIYNFTNPVTISIRSLVELFADLNKFPKSKLQFSKANKRDDTMSFLSLDMSKFQHRFPNFVFNQLEVGLKEYIQ